MRHRKHDTDVSKSTLEGTRHCLSLTITEKNSQHVHDYEMFDLDDIVDGYYPVNLSHADGEFSEMLENESDTFHW